MATKAKNFLRTTAAAKFLGVNPATMRAWRKQKRGPAYCRVGGTYRYSLEDLEAYLRARRFDPAAEAAP